MRNTSELLRRMIAIKDNNCKLELDYQRSLRAMQNHPFTGKEEGIFSDGFNHGFANGYDWVRPLIQTLLDIREGCAFAETPEQKAICERIDKELERYHA